ncbi:MAG TPA: AmmeMemoRadiSam system protein B [Polyangiaceae bacterium]|jgi:AmmeMemoRadiSam system protein B|nr:AmmeMemoRadiSam system protein B [Polyangiaceae bacterium]
MKSGLKVRRAAVAGSFYPADPQELRAAVQGYLEKAEGREAPAPKAIIAPHAGYIYSGPVAATAYKGIWSARGQIKRVVLLGPAHRVGFQGLALSSADRFATPLGDIPVDLEALRLITGSPGVLLLDEAHAREHSLEVHLPFLQEVVGDFTLVPVAVGEASPEDVARVIDALWGGPETLVVVSSDLSHYYNYATARELDRETSRAIVAMRPEEIGYEQACGRRPVNGLLVTARRRGLRAEVLDLRSSGDTAGDRAEVVGYGAYCFEE